MILQRDPGALPQIHEWGCYLMSLIWWAVTFQRVPVNIDTINHLFREFEKQGYVDDDAYVLNPSGILRYLKIPASIVIEGTHRLPPDRLEQRREFVIGKWEYPKLGYQHFVAMVEDAVTYDPWGSWDGVSPYSRTVAQGELVSKRVFRLESE